MGKFKWLLLLVVCCGIAPCGGWGAETVDAKRIPVFPGAVGFGTDTVAGRGGQIIHVTNLDADGPGSFAEAVQGRNPRIIVFDVGGIIRLTRNIAIDYPFMTIAGQTAPPPGITLRGGGLEVKSHDILIQHLRIRVGDDPDGPHPSSRDAIKILGSGAYNVVIDHASLSWAVDENLSTWRGPGNITVSNSIISEGLSRSMHSDKEHSKGLLIGPNTKKLSVVNCLFAHNRSRNPLIYGGSSVVLTGNIFYNAGSKSFVSISDGWKTGPSDVSIVNNLYIKGLDSVDQSAIKIESDCPAGTRVYLSGNVYPGTLLINKSYAEILVDKPAIWHASLESVDAKNLQSRLLSVAGARAGGLDQVDKRVLGDVSNNSGRIIDSPREVGGWPQYEMVKRKFEVPPDPNGDADGDGYTNIEEAIHQAIN